MMLSSQRLKKYSFLEQQEQNVSPNQWALQEMNCSQQKININKNKSANQCLLSSLSNNLITYEQSYKKQSQRKSQSSRNKLQNRVNQSEMFSCIKKRKIKRKLNFIDDTQEKTDHQRNLLQDNKQNAHTINHQNTQQKSQKLQRRSNLLQLQKMFQIMKQFNSLNQTILPYKVNLNQISQKRILANMIFNKFKRQQQTINSAQDMQSIQIHRNNQQKRGTIDTQLVPVSRRVYSLDIKTKDKLYNLNIKNKSKKAYQHQRQSYRTQNKLKNGQINVFSLRDFGLKYQNRKGLTKDKKTFSLRKTQNHGLKKTIEQIKQKKSRKYSINLNNFENVQNQCKIDKQQQKFSDSRLFLKSKACLKQKCQKTEFIQNQRYLRQINCILKLSSFGKRAFYRKNCDQIKSQILKNIIQSCEDQ